MPLSLGLGLWITTMPNGPASSLVNQPAILSLGESTSGMAGARSLATDLQYQYTTDPNTNVYDAGQLISAGAGIKVLKQASVFTFTVTVASPGVVSATAHGLSNNDPFVPYTTGALPTGLVQGTRYWVINANPNDFQLAATRGGAAINTSGTQSGTHTGVANAAHDQQPGGPSYVDATYQAAVGDSGEFNRIYRSQVPTARLDHVPFQRGGGSFDDTNATFGRAVNYDVSLSDGAYNELSVMLNAYKAALAAEGKQPQWLRTFLTLGGNTIIHGAPYLAPFEGKLTALIAKLRTDFIGNCIVVLNVPSLLQTGLNSTDRATIRSAMVNIYNADPTRIVLMNMDGMRTPVDGVHFDAPSHTIRGGYEAQEALGLFYPTKNNPLLSAPIYPIREWHFNAQTNSIVSGFVASSLDRIGNSSTLSIGSGSRPAVATRTLGNGMTARFATWDNSDDVMVDAAGACMLQRSGGFILGLAVKGAAQNNGTVIAEGTESGGGTKLFCLASDASGNACLTIVDDTSTAVLNLTNLGVGQLFDGNWHRFILVYDGTTFTAYKDGVAGSNVSYTRNITGLTNLTLGARRVTGSYSSFYGVSLGAVVVENYSTTGLSQHITDLDGYLQRHWVN